jgi:hypothetical protein
MNFADRNRFSKPGGREDEIVGMLEKRPGNRR